MNESKVVLVTGGAGYIGSHACKALAARGFLPVTFDNLSRGHEDAVRWGPLERGDLADQGRLGEVFERHRPGAVLHFAAFAYVGESTADPALYYRNNVAGSLSLFEAMATNGVERLVFSSTCATYGVPPQGLIDEATPQAPINPYGATKLMVERMLRDLAGAGKLRSIALRYFNAAGADPDGEIGERHEPETHLIPLAIGAARGTSPPLTVFGDDYPTADGTCIRDYIHVSDLAEAHVAALEAIERGPAFDAFNLGTGQGHSVRDILAAVAEATGKAVPFTMGPRRDGDPPMLVSDARRANDILGWHPQISSIASIVGSAARWMEKQAR